MPAATVNGVNLAYVVKGRGAPLVAMHGFSNSIYTWEPVMDAFSRRFQAFAYDHRGHGGSSKKQSPYEIQTLTDDLLGLLNFWGLDRVHLMGHSMGGRVALLFALQHPERLESLMLIASSAAAPEGEMRQRFELLRKMALDEGMAAVLKSEDMRATLPRDYIDGPSADKFKRLFLKNTPTDFVAAADAILQTPDMTGRLGEIQAPTWVCMGEKDAGAMAYGEMFEERIPNCVRTIIPACGHFPMQDAPEAFSSAFDDFVDTVMDADS